MSAELPRRLAALGSGLALAAVALAGGGAGAEALRPAAMARPAASPTVQMMVVGAGNVILSSDRYVTVSPASVQVAGRSCAVAGGTPLAALVDLYRLGGPAFAVRDYGHCGSSPGSSGELFVYSIDGETNHGQNGWEYEVDDVAGSTGAADPSGPEGDGRLLSGGERVLWFWCAAFAGGCQRTLGVSAPSSAATRGRLTVRVVGYDNEGRGVPMSGALVRLGSSSATTGSSGRATLTAPSSRGLYSLTATRPGSVPSFPETITVR